jgi:DNA-binding transcriptional ArsR family regulator
MARRPPCSIAVARPSERVGHHRQDHRAGRSAEPHPDPRAGVCVRLERLKAEADDEQLPGLVNGRLVSRVERVPEPQAVGRRVLPEAGGRDRSIPALFNAAQGYRIRDATYRALAEDISELVASRDLRALVEAGLLTRVGERRGRTYLASEQLKRIELSIRSPQARDEPDPFIVAEAGPLRG